MRMETPDLSDIGFQISENTIRSQTVLETLLDESIKRTKRATALQCKQEQINVNLPLLGMLKQWAHSLVGDVLRYVHTQQQQEEQQQIIVGIPDEDVDAYIATIEEVLTDVEEVKKVVGSKGKTGTKIAELTLRMKKRLGELAESLEEDRLGIPEEEYDTLIMDDDEPEDEPEDAPLISDDPPQTVEAQQ